MKLLTNNGLGNQLHVKFNIVEKIRKDERF